MARIIRVARLCVNPPDALFLPAFSIAYAVDPVARGVLPINSIWARSRGWPGVRCALAFSPVRRSSRLVARLSRLEEGITVNPYCSSQAIAEFEARLHESVTCWSLRFKVPRPKVVEEAGCHLQLSGSPGRGCISCSGGNPGSRDCSVSARCRSTSVAAPVTGAAPALRCSFGDHPYPPEESGRLGALAC